MIAVVMVAALTQWSRWLLPISVLLYLLIVLPTALFSGFWQAVIVSLWAVAAQTYVAAHLSRARLAADPIQSVTLVAFVLVALIVSRLSARITDHAREAESRGHQMQDLYEFTRRTLQIEPAC